MACSSYAHPYVLLAFKFNLVTLALRAPALMLGLRLS
jgi:hypothetical protein